MRDDGIVGRPAPLRIDYNKFWREQMRRAKIISFCWGFLWGCILTTCGSIVLFLLANE
jgi:hypothetical protein